MTGKDPAIREALRSAYREISARVIEDIAHFVSATEDNGRCAGRADVLVRIIDMRKKETTSG